MVQIDPQDDPQVDPQADSQADPKQIKGSLKVTPS